MPTLGNGSAGTVRKVLSDLHLETVCDQARCPNRGHCYQRGTSTFLILGSSCTRKCAYCAIERDVSSPPPPDPSEPSRVAEAASRMGLRYVVLTSVTRDDLPDGGAGHFAETVRGLRRRIPGVEVEVLTPDFQGARESLETIAASGPDVFNHNLETVERLFPSLRPVASYRQSLEVLRVFGELAPGIPVKSGLMVGLGEDRGDVERSMEDLRGSGVSILTIGQYLQPTSDHFPVHRYVDPEEFEEYRVSALSMGFSSVASGPLVRSSYHADLLRGSVRDG